MEIPYFQQEGDVDCAAACLTMALHAFGVDGVRSDVLRHQLRVDPLMGTSVDDLGRVAREYFHGDIRTASQRINGEPVGVDIDTPSLIELIKALAGGNLVVVNYLIPVEPPIQGEPHNVLFWENGWFEGHLAIARSIQKDPSDPSSFQITLCDPLLGDEYPLPLTEFARRWRSQNDGYVHWMLLVHGLRQEIRERVDQLWTLSSRG